MEVPIGQPAVIEGERPCIRCGYALAGLPTSGLCPECGTPTARSLMGDLLVYSDPDYVATLRRGATTVLISVVMLMAGIVASIVIKSGAPGGMFLMSYYYIGVHAVFVLGWMWFTTPDVGQLSSNKGEKPRRVVRGCLVALIAVKVATVVLPVVVTVPGHLLTALRGLDNVLLAVGLIAGMKYLMWLSQRIPSREVFQGAGRLTSYLWVAAVCGAITVGATLLNSAAQAWGLPPGANKLVDIAVKLGQGVVKLVGGIVTLIAFIQFCVLFSKLRAALARVGGSEEVKR